jgi:hypothetical protein
MDPALLIAGGGFAGFIALIVWLGKRGATSARARKAADEKAIAEYGWEIVASAPRELIELGTASPFRQGRERKVGNLIRSSLHSVLFVSYEYSYITEHKDDEGKVQRSTNTYTVTSIDIDGQIDGITIMPEGLWDGKYDLDVESDDFNKKWRVQAADKRMAHALLSPTVIALLVDRETEKMPIIFEPGKIWTYSSGGHQVAKLARKVEVLSGVAREIPAFVYKEAKPGKKPAKYVEPAALVDDPTPILRNPNAGAVGTPGGRSAGATGRSPRAAGRSAGGTGRAAGTQAPGRSAGGTGAASKPAARGRSAGGTGSTQKPQATRRSAGGTGAAKSRARDAGRGTGRGRSSGTGKTR